jgi:hypothetical protein
MEVPSVTGSAADAPLLIKYEDFTTAMLAALDTGGGDLRFSSDAAGATQLACEVVTFTKATGDIVWVNVPSVSTGAIIRVWGDKTGESQPAIGVAFGRNAVWSDYAMVDHGGLFIDSSGNVGSVADIGTVDATLTNDFGGGGYGQTDASNRIDYTSVPNVQVPFTLQHLYNRQNNNVQSRSLGIGNTSTTTNYSHLQPTDTGLSSENNGTNDGISTAINTNAWYSLHGVVGSSTVEAFVNGVSDGATTGSVSMPTTTNIFRVGASADKTPFGATEGYVSELRIRNGILTPAHVLIESGNLLAAGAWWTATDGGGGGGGGGGFVAAWAQGSNVILH